MRVGKRSEGCRRRRGRREGRQREEIGGSHKEDGRKEREKEKGEEEQQGCAGGSAASDADRQLRANSLDLMHIRKIVLRVLVVSHCAHDIRFQRRIYPMYTLACAW